MARALLCAGALVLVVLPTACGATLALNVIVAGAGRGTVAGGGLSCRGICSTTIADPSVTLTATADSDSTLVGWAGACSGTGTSPSCSVAMGAAPKTAVAYFRRTTVSAGAFHTCALKRAGDLECWGRNYEGELADGTTYSPNDGYVKTLAGFTNFADVAAGGFHTCALASDGSVWCWGDNTHSQVGNRTSFGQPPNYSSPQQVSLINSSSPTLMLPSAIALAAGGYHTCALLMDQSVACWGFNQSGQVDAVHPGTDWFQPNLVSGVSGAVAVTAGAYHSCALDSAGKVICWGYNSDLELGVPAPSQGFASGNVGSGLIGGAITATRIAGGVSAGLVGTTNYGGYHTCAILTSGSVACWGYGAFGELNGMLLSAPSASPLSPGANAPVTAIAAGGYHSCSVAGGAVQCWGSNGFGQHGGLTTTGPTAPTGVVGLSGVTTVSAGAYHTCAVDSSAMVNCWGLNDNGQAGRTASNTKANPQLGPLVPLGF